MAAIRSSSNRYRAGVGQAVDIGKGMASASDKNEKWVPVDKWIPAPAAAAAQAPARDDWAFTDSDSDDDAAPAPAPVRDDWAFSGSDSDSDIKSASRTLQRKQGKQRKQQQGEPRTWDQYKQHVKHVRKDVEDYTGPVVSDASEAARLLATHGVVVMPMFSPDQCSDMRERYQAALAQAPEFRKGCWPLVPVAGGYGATGHPSGFHDPFAREAREKLYDSALPVFQQYAALVKASRGDGDDLFFAALFERNKYRVPGRRTEASGICRKQSPHLVKGTEVFGSYVNVGEEAHGFTCVPGSHKDMNGWDAQGPDDWKPSTVAEANLHYKALKIVRVPPGHCIIFFQHLLQCLLPERPRRKTCLLLLQSYTLSPDPSPMFPVDQVIAEQGVPVIKSGQVPILYDKLHAVSFMGRRFTIWAGVQKNLCEWSQDTFVDAFLDKLPDGRVVAKRVAPSLEKAGLPKHPPYTAKDLALFHPARV
jgi:hypothetical protein